MHSYIFVTSVHEIWSLLLLHLHHLQIKMYCDSVVSCTIPTSAVLVSASAVLVSASAVLVSLLLCNISSLSAAILCCKLQFSLCVLIVNNPALFALLMQLFRFVVSVSFSVVVLVAVLRSVVVSSVVSIALSPSARSSRRSSLIVLLLSIVYIYCSLLLRYR